MDKVQKSTYIYNAITETAITCSKMPYDAYAMTYLIKRPFVYACGGRSTGEDTVAILKKCARYNIDTNVWELIAELNI